MKTSIYNKLKQSSFDSLSYAYIDFNKNTFKIIESESRKIYDLASLTKPLTLSASFFIDKKLFNKDMFLLLNHQAGIIPWGILDKQNWKEQINSYSISKSKTVYSDFSALKLQLEIEKIINTSLLSHVSSIFDSNLKFWKDLTNKEKLKCVETGFRNGVIKGDVNDQNSFNINGFTSHAGLFSTIEGLVKTLINLNTKTKFIDIVANEKKINDEKEFVFGFERASKNSLAGTGQSDLTFGHLGFTGTMFWIDPLSKKGVVVLTNATQNYWYDRKILNSLRREIGSDYWNS